MNQRELYSTDIIILKNKFRIYIFNHLIDILQNNSEHNINLSEIYKEIIKFLKLWKIKLSYQGDIYLYMLLSLLLSPTIKYTDKPSTLNYYITHINYNDVLTLDFIHDFLNIFKSYKFKIN